VSQGLTVTDLDARHSFADRFDLTRAIGQRHYAELGRTATAPNCGRSVQAKAANYMCRRTNIRPE
jgi:hypothetical protein